MESFDLVREAYQKNRVDLTIQGDVHEAERYFKIARGDEDAIDAMAAITEERLVRLRELSSGEPLSLEWDLAGGLYKSTAAL